MEQGDKEPPYERARETVDPDRLLPGEEAAVLNGAQASRWVTIYEELMAAEQALAACITEELTVRSDEARRELEEFDLTIIKAQQERFRRRLGYWRGRAERSGNETAGGMEGRKMNDRGERITVLFIEDDPEFVEMYKMALEMEGYAVEVAGDGRTGLEMIRRRKPDLVFLDMRMPGLSGLDVLRELRSDPSTAELPAVVLSNYDEPKMVDEARRLGAVQWMVKINATPRTLADRMHEWIRVEHGKVSES